MKTPQNTVYTLICFIMLLIAIWPDHALAMRMYYDALYGLNNAEVVAMIQVEEIWTEESRYDGYTRGRELIRGRVRECWKGELKPDTEILIDDTGICSILAHQFEKNPLILLYLTLEKDREHTSKKIWKSHWVKPDTEPTRPQLDVTPTYSYLRESIPTVGADNWRKDPKIADEIELLDLYKRSLVNSKQQQSLTESITVDDNQVYWHSELGVVSGEFAISYALDQFQGALSDADSAAIFAMADRIQPSLKIYRGIMAALERSTHAEKLVVWPAQTCLKFWRNIDPAQRSELINWYGRGDETIPSEAIDGIVPLLETMIRENDPDADKALDMLVRQRSEAAVQLFQKHQDLSPLLALKLARMLQIEPEFFNWPAFSIETSNVDDSTLYSAWRLNSLPEDDDGYFYRLQETEEQFDAVAWRALVPWFQPHFSQPDSIKQRRLIALFRTMGVTLERQDDIYVYRPDIPSGLPLRLTLKSPENPIPANQPVVIRWTLTALRPVIMGNNNIGWGVKGEQTGQYIDTHGADYFLSSAFSDRWKSSRLSSQNNQDSNKTAQHWPAGFILQGEQTFTNLDATLKRFDEKSTSRKDNDPGLYKIRAFWQCIDNGSNSGVDAWTGLIISPAIQIVVTSTTEPYQRLPVAEK